MKIIKYKNKDYVLYSDHIISLEIVKERVRDLEKWVNDLQSGMYINCVYCGHRYGPSESMPASMADVLKRHIEQCPKHPMSTLKKELQRLKDVFEGCFK